LALEEEFEAAHVADSRFELFDCFENLVDVIIDSDVEPSGQMSTIIDLSQERPEMIRRGQDWEAAEALL
jgi:tRNA A37 threonylcarbamoyladenosine synthetase subunit TsaC/SUA5/YrdC